AEVRDAVLYGSRRMDGTIGLQFPPHFSSRGLERVQVHVVRADEHEVARDDRRRFDLGVRFEGPEEAAVARAHRVHRAAKIADEDGLIADGWGRFTDRGPRLVFPALLSAIEIDRDEIAVPGADIDRAVAHRG